MLSLKRVFLMQCDMCGAESKLFRVEIEGTELSVCRNCSRYGKVLSAPKPPAPKKQKKPVQKEEEYVETLVEDFSRLIKQKREEKGLKQKELAAKMAERESLIQKIESGHFTPSLNLARKFERLFGVKLIEKVPDKQETAKKSNSGKLTIGDVIKLKS